MYRFTIVLKDGTVITLEGDNVEQLLRIYQIRLSDVDYFEKEEI